MKHTEYIKAIKGVLEGKKGNAKYIFGLIQSNNEEVQTNGDNNQCITYHYDLMLNYDNDIYIWENQKTTNCNLIKLENEIKEVIKRIDNKN